jgi:hypothetical protein
MWHVPLFSTDSIAILAAIYICPLLARASFVTLVKVISRERPRQRDLRHFRVQFCPCMCAIAIAVTGSNLRNTEFLQRADNFIIIDAKTCCHKEKFSVRRTNCGVSRFFVYDFNFPEGRKRETRFQHVDGIPEHSSRRQLIALIL